MPMGKDLRFSHPKYELFLKTSCEGSFSPLTLAFHNPTFEGF
jgi:hypothetical protein